MYTTKGDDVYVLLGRERETPGWRQGSHKWSAFSGKVEPHENALQAAAREFTEEACACVSLDATQVVPTSEKKVLEALHDRGEAVQLSTFVKGERLVYCTYIIRAGFKRHDKLFLNTRAKLLELDAVFRTFYRAKKLADAAPRFFLPGFILSTHLVVVGFRVVSDTEVLVTMHESNPHSALDFTFAVSRETSAILRDLNSAWQDVLTFIRVRGQDPIFQHPAVNVIRSANCIVSAYVNKAYLEKCEINWWKLSDLLQAREAHFLHDTPFRRLFLDNIHVLARKIYELERKRIVRNLTSEQEEPLDHVLLDEDAVQAGECPCTEAKGDDNPRLYDGPLSQQTV